MTRPDLYHDGHRTLQDRFDSRRLADRIEERLASGTIAPQEKEFIESRDMFFLATADREGRPTCSYKGGDPGFVRVVDDKTLEFPLYDGNGMFLSAGNVSVNENVGLLFVDFHTGHRLRVEGTAQVRESGAGLAMRVTVRAAYPNCSRYVHKMETVARSEFVPRAGCVPPVPGWKRADWAKDVLPRDGHGGTT